MILIALLIYILSLIKLQGLILVFFSTLLRKNTPKNPVVFYLFIHQMYNKK